MTAGPPRHRNRAGRLGEAKYTERPSRYLCAGPSAAVTSMLGADGGFRGSSQIDPGHRNIPARQTFLGMCQSVQVGG